MPLLTYGRIGLRNVARNRRRSLSTVGAVAFGLFCLIVFLGLKAGLHRHMIANAMRLDIGALQIHAAGYAANRLALQPLAGEQVVSEVLDRSGLQAVSRRLRTSALVLAGRNSASILLTGVDPAAEARVTVIHRRVVIGDYLAGEKTILLGADLATGLGARVGDPVKLMVWDAFGHQVVRSFPVGGIFRTGQAGLDATRAFVRLPVAQELLDVGDAVTGIAVQSAPEDVDRLVAKLSAELPADRFRVDGWERIAPDVRQLIELNDATMLLLSLIVFALVAMGIANTMASAVYERFFEIGVLATIGTTPGGIVGMVVLESLCLGVAASLVGTVTGVATGIWLTWHGVDLTPWTSANQYFAGEHVLHAHLTLFDIVAANLATLATAFVAGIYPAVKAARLTPVEAIRQR